MPPPKPLASQADFDEAVSTNVEDFDMSRSEAVVAALEELRLQGKDTSNIITENEEEVARHPASVASLALASAVSASSPDPKGVVSNAAKAARDLSEALEAKKEDAGGGGEHGAADDDASASLKIATAAGAVGSIYKALRVLHKEFENGERDEDLCALLSALSSLCSADAGRDAAAAAGVPGVLCDLLNASSSTPSSSATSSPSSTDVVAALGSAAAAVATRHEGNKCALVDCGFGASAAAALRRRGKPSPPISPRAVRSLSSALCSLATADDPRPAASRAFQNGRTLGGEGVPAACLSAFERAVEQAGAAAAEEAGSPSPAAATSAEEWLDTAASAAAAARRAVVNDELCREFAEEARAVEVVLGALLPSTATSSEDNGKKPIPLPRTLRHARLTRSCCSLLRQLAGSDALKAPIVEASGFELVSLAVREHYRSDEKQSHAVAEQALGLLVALTLRNPDAAAVAVEAGCARAAADVLNSTFVVPRSNSSKQKFENDDEDDGEEENRPSTSSSSPSPSYQKNPHQWAQRQACAAIRNLASRSAELRPVLLATTPSSSSSSSPRPKIEALLRAARDRYPEACGDVGAAALRDLGCDDYEGKRKAAAKGNSGCSSVESRVAVVASS